LSVIPLHLSSWPDAYNMSAAASEGHENLLSHDAFLTSNILLQHQPTVLMEQSTTPQADPIDLQIPQLQMLDVSTPSTPSVVDPSLLAPGASSPSVGTPSSSSESRPVKKRKSWGQVLPEPKTNLPPRKRAKTDDEKEQRRIERVKRNRLAAHNSRERKRVEMEDLQQQNNALEAELAVLRAELAAMRNLVGGKLPTNMSFAAPQAPASTTSITSAPEALTPSASSSSAHSHASISTPSMLDDASTPASESMSQPATPFEPTMEDLHLQTPDIFSLDDSELTQHSAAMLCDLQCRSDPSQAWMSSSPRSQLFQQTLAIFSLLLLQFQVSVMTAVSTTCSTLISSTLRQQLSLMTTQAHRTPAILSLTRSLRASTPSQLHSLTTLMVLTARYLLCTPTKAPRLLSATGVAPRQKPSLNQQLLSTMTSGLLRRKLDEARDTRPLDRRRQVRLNDDHERLGLAADIKRVCQDLENKELRNKPGETE